jgi:hypothetical protein
MVVFEPNQGKQKSPLELHYSARFQNKIFVGAKSKDFISTISFPSTDLILK